MNIRLEMHPHRLTDTADDRVEVIAVPEKAHAFPIRRNALLLGEKIAARDNIRLVGGFGDAEGDVAGAGVVGDNGEGIVPVC